MSLTGLLKLKLFILNRIKYRINYLKRAFFTLKVVF